jgi:hypothetical protein
VVFGPKPRDYSYKVPKKLKRLAYRSILSQKMQEDRLMVVEDFTVESGKTRELVKILKGLMPENGKRTAIVISGEDSMLKRAGRNVPGLSILSYNRLRAHDLFYAGTVIVFEKAAEELGRFYGGGKAGRTVVRPKVKPAGRPTVKRGAADGGESAAKPTTKPAAKSAEKPVAKPTTKPAAKSTEKPAAKPAAKAEKTTEARPKAKSPSKPAAKASGKTPTERGAKPTAKTPAKPVAKPAAETATKTAKKVAAKRPGTASSKAKSSKSSGTGKSATDTSARRTAGNKKEGA